MDRNSFKKKSSKSNQVESVFLKNKFKKNEGDSLTSTVENRHKIMNTQISVDYNKDASILQMLDQTDGETSGILEEECIKKVDINPENRKIEVVQRRN